MRNPQFSSLEKRNIHFKTVINKTFFPQDMTVLTSEYIFPVTFRLLPLKVVKGTRPPPPTLQWSQEWLHSCILSQKYSARTVHNRISHIGQAHWQNIGIWKSQDIWKGWPYWSSTVVPNSRQAAGYFCDILYIIFLKTNYLFLYWCRYMKMKLISIAVCWLKNNLVSTEIHDY